MDLTEKGHRAGVLCQQVKNKTNKISEAQRVRVCPKEYEGRRLEC